MKHVRVFRQKRILARQIGRHRASWPPFHFLHLFAWIQPVSARVGVEQVVFGLHQRFGEIDRVRENADMR